MPPSRFIQLTDEEDVELRQIEQSPHFKPKVRLRAQVLRLSSRGYNLRSITAYTDRSPQSVGRDLDRWTERGFEGLLDGTPPGNSPTITEEVREFMEEKLSSEQRTYNATQLAEAVEEHFAIEVSSEAVRQHLNSMGYSWKRTRYVPGKPPDPEAEREAREELDGLKKGHEKAR